MLTVLNTRVLVIDDDEVVRDSIREVLLPRRRDTSGLDAAASALFDDDEPVVEASAPLATSPRARLAGIGIDIELSEASSGMEALEKIQAAVEANRPFAMIFLDMRMPGWDGLETARRIRLLDRAAEIVFVTAYSDHGIDEIVEQAGPNVGFHCKPFAPEEIRQIASKGIYDWNKIHNLEQLIEGMGRLRSERSEVDTLLQNVLHQVSDWMLTSSALIARGNVEAGFSPLVGCGPLSDQGKAGRLLQRIAGRPVPEGSFRFEGASYGAVAEGDIIAVWEDRGRINIEKVYLLRLFVEHASSVLENAKLHEQLLLGEKLAAVGLAIGTVAHDLRSPIGGIQATLEVVRMELRDRPRLIDLLDGIGRYAEEAMELVGDILDYARRSKMQKRLLRVETLLDRAVEKTRITSTVKHVRLRVDCQAGLGMFGDSKKLERVLINLIINASEVFDPHQGRTAHAIVLAARAEDGQVRITVADNGPGIPESIRPTVFEPFVTLGKSQGTGLGLAIARQIVEAHGGQLTFTTGPDGTTFLLDIPQFETATK